MMNKEFMMQQGGVSKATKMLNLSEASQSSYHVNQLKYQWQEMYFTLMKD